MSSYTCVVCVMQRSIKLKFITAPTEIYWNNYNFVNCKLIMSINN